MSFTKAQQAQLDLALEHGVENSVCQGHPEWGPTLMNLCWNREKTGDPISPAVRAGEWLCRNLPMKDGVAEDDFRIVMHVFKAFDSDDVPAVPVFKPGGSLDMDAYLFQIARLELIWKGGPVLWSGRISVNNAGPLVLPVIMGEGVPEANAIAGQLQSLAANKAETEPSREPMEKMLDRQLAMQMVLLTLDDMNIRGYQIPYALEYAGGSTEILYGLLNDGRSEELCAYVNMRSARDCLAGKPERCQAAVPSGASFCHDGLLSDFALNRSSLAISRASAENFAAEDVKPLETNWSRLDVTSGIDLAQTEKILSARGFEQVRKIKREDRYDGTPVYSLVWYRPETRDYVTAPSAMDDNACYGGMHLTVHRDPGAMTAGKDFWWKCSSGPDKDPSTRYFEFTNHDGLFQHYDDACAAGTCDPDWEKIGFGSYGIPVPEYFKLPFLRRNEIDTGNASMDALMADMGGYYFERLVNNVLCYYDAALASSPSPHYALYENWFLSDGVRDAVGWKYGKKSDLAMLCAAAFAWLEIPDDTVRLFTASLDYEHPEEFLNGAALAAGLARAYGLPGPAALPVPLPWLEK